MAKYDKSSQNHVEEAIREMKIGKLKLGKSDKIVTNPKQAVAIGLSEARKDGDKIPKNGSKKNK